jgi:hypothetical protein
MHVVFNSVYDTGNALKLFFVELEEFMGDV